MKRPRCSPPSVVLGQNDGPRCVQCLSVQSFFGLPSIVSGAPGHNRGEWRRRHSSHTDVSGRSVSVNTQEGRVGRDSGTPVGRLPRGEGPRASQEGAVARESS